MRKRKRTKKTLINTSDKRKSKWPINRKGAYPLVIREDSTITD
jgi:hypothetical protein